MSVTSMAQLSGIPTVRTSGQLSLCIMPSGIHEAALDIEYTAAATGHRWPDRPGDMCNRVAR
jgi:hypothetical protein